jgi:riboflavin synthase
LTDQSIEGSIVFTGLIQSLGHIAEIHRTDDGMAVGIDTDLVGELAEGDSIAVNGVCLTATAITATAFRAEVMNETLHRSGLADLAPGAGVNLELAMRAGDRLGGHFVQGHVDAVGTVGEIVPDGFARRVRVQADPDLLRYVVHKGSITVDGVSLTVAELDDRSFTVSLIPETIERTTLGDAVPGTHVNLEVDVLAKYVEKLVNSPEANSLGSSPPPRGGAAVLEANIPGEGT